MDVNNGVELVRYKHVPTMAELLAQVTALSEKGARLRLWVFERGVSFSSDDLRKIVEHIRAQSALAERTAIVAAADRGFGIFRMFQAYAEGVGTDIRIFRDEQEALEWVKKGDSTTE